MSTNTFSGSCLCGSVQYEIVGEPTRFYHCHCRRCRKATGTGHATNIILLNPTSARWIKGEALLGRYKVPEAERFSTSFCTQCGSPLPRFTPDLSLAVIPAGSLDSELTVSPQARIFWDSRAGWSCANADIPTFSEYPPQQ